MWARIFLFALCSLLMVAPARAEILMTFYSHDFDGSFFPHAFIRLQGTVEETGEQVDTNYGFTAKRITPAILFGSVYHKVSTVKPDYLAESMPHFTVRLDDGSYRAVVAHVDAWRNIPGKGYRLGKRNCVHFVLEAAAIAGLNVNRKSRYFKKPKSFLVEVKSLNDGLELIAPEAEVGTEPDLAQNPPPQIASKPVE